LKKEKRSTSTPPLGLRGLFWGEGIRYYTESRSCGGQEEEILGENRKNIFQYVSIDIECRANDGL